MQTILRALCPIAAAALAVVLAACGDTAKLPFSAGVGPDPALPPPNKTLIPTVEIARAKGWPNGAKPVPAAGMTVSALATGAKISDHSLM